MNKQIVIGEFLIREWEPNKEWVIGLKRYNQQNSYSSRFDIKTYLDENDLAYSVAVCKIGGKVYPWFGRSGQEPLAAFPDYWTAKKFLNEYIEPKALIKMMTGEL